MITKTKYFHIDSTTSLYFLRGYDLRTYMLIQYKYITTIKSTLMIITNKTKILKYSLKKNLTNSPLEYSVLNPETSSDSPSIRSIGVRLTSIDNT